MQLRVSGLFLWVGGGGWAWMGVSRGGWSE